MASRTVSHALDRLRERQEARRIWQRAERHPDDRVGEPRVAWSDTPSDEVIDHFTLAALDLVGAYLAEEPETFERVVAGEDIRGVAVWLRGFVEEFLEGLVVGDDGVLSEHDLRERGALNPLCDLVSVCLWWAAASGGERVDADAVRQVFAGIARDIRQDIADS